MAKPLLSICSSFSSVYAYVSWIFVPGMVPGTHVSLWPVSLKSTGVSICLNALMAGIPLTGKENTGVKIPHLVLKTVPFNLENSSWQMDLYQESCSVCFWNAFPERTAPAKWEPPGAQFDLIVTGMITKSIHYSDCTSPVKIEIHYAGNDAPDTAILASSLGNTNR